MLRKIGLIGLASLAAPLAAFAQTTGAAAIDVSAFTGTLSNQQTSVLAVVGAAFTLLGIVVGVKYIRRAAK
jgi:hypothetical protein